MKPSHSALALAATAILLFSPAMSLAKGPPPKKPPMTSSQTKGAGKPARHGAARNLVSTGKAVVQRGKQSLRSQKENLIRLIGRAEGLKPQRMRLRQMTLDAYKAYRSNPSPATRAAWKQATAAYMPVRQAHETARGQRDAANIRYRRTKLQRETAVKAAAAAAGAGTPRPPTAGRPQIRRQAFIQIPRGFASAAASPNIIYSNLGPARSGSSVPLGHYDVFDASKFKADAKNHYDRLTPSEAGLDRQSGAAGSSGASSGTLPTMPFFIAPKAPIRENAYDDV